MSFVIAGGNLLLRPELEQQSLGHSIRGKYNSAYSIGCLFVYLHDLFKVYAMI